MIDILNVALYVDCLIFTRNNLQLIVDFRKELMMRYEMNGFGMLHHFLGIEIYPENDEVFICQKKHADKILKKFGLFKCSPTDIPLVLNENLKKEDGGKNDDASNYRSLVGNLFYLTSTRTSFMFAARLLSLYMND